jgi:hypothetical protein
MREQLRRKEKFAKALNRRKQSGRKLQILSFKLQGSAKSTIYPRMVSAD